MRARAKTFVHCSTFGRSLSSLDCRSAALVRCGGSSITDRTLCRITLTVPIVTNSYAINRRYIVIASSYVRFIRAPSMAVPSVSKSTHYNGHRGGAVVNPKDFYSGWNRLRISP